MAHIIKNCNFNDHVDQLIDRNIKIDRIICDFPSFVKRHPGIPSDEAMQIMMGKLIKLIKSDSMSPEASLTISFTGIAQETFDQWMVREGNEYLDHLPEEDFTCFYNYLMDTRTRAMFIGRRDNWACVRTYRLKTSSFVPNTVAPIYNVPGRFADFPYPEDRSLYTVHSFRAPVHHGINEAREDLVWIENQGLNNVELQSKFLRYPNGLLINFNMDRHTYIHMPAMVYNAGKYMTQELFDKLTDQSNDPGLFRMNRTASFHFAMWLVERYSNENETVFNPFMELGEVACATMISKRTLIGTEFNAGRTESVRNMQLQLLTL